MKKVNNNKIRMIVTNFVRIALILIYIRGWLTQDHSQDFIITITFFMTYYPSILEKRFGVYLPARLEIVITLFIFAAQVLGEMNGFYDKITWWDTMLHTTSGVILGLVGFLFVYLLNEKGDKNVNLSPIFVVIFAFCFAITMGVFWEFFEYGADRLLGYNMQKFRMPGQDGLVDTMEDLIVDTIGAIIACIGGWIYMKNKKDTLFNDVFDEWFESERIKNGKAKE
ncbi:MAG: hypothetical protein IJE68_06160 [Clostridia bacterium]|nr:hypothetical protein [Clostridia bacterium]